MLLKAHVKLTRYHRHTSKHWHQDFMVWYAMHIYSCIFLKWLCHHGAIVQYCEKKRKEKNKGKF